MGQYQFGISATAELQHAIAAANHLSSVRACISIVRHSTLALAADGKTVPAEAAEDGLQILGGTV